MPRIFPVVGLLFLVAVTAGAAALGLAQAPTSSDAAVHNASMADLSAPRLHVHEADVLYGLSSEIDANVVVPPPWVPHPRPQLLGNVVTELREVSGLRGWVGAMGRYEWSGLYTQLPGWHLPPWRNQVLLRRWQKARLSLTVHIQAGYITSLEVDEHSWVFKFAIRPA